MVDVVGLRYVTEGEREAINGLQRYDRAQQALERTSRSLEQAIKRGSATFEQAYRVYDALERSGMSYADVLKGVEQNERMAAAAAQAFNNQLLGVDRATKSASASARVFEQAMRDSERAAQEAKREAQMLAAETEMLARAYNPVRAATLVYERQVEQLNRAQQIGVLTTDQLRNELGKLRMAYGRVGSSAEMAHQFTNQFGSVTQLAGVKTNRFGMIAQQVGYQVGDFFVQIQSGTNAFVAFGQQATQLAGLLPGVAGAVVGISISIGTMLLAAWDRTRKAQDDTAESVSDLREEYEQLTRSLAEYARAQEAAARGFTPEEALSVDVLAEAEARLAAAQERMNALDVDRAYILMGNQQIEVETLDVKIRQKALADAQLEVEQASKVVAELRNRLNSENVDELERQVSIEARALELMKVEAAYGSDSIQLIRAKNALEYETLAAKLEQEAAVGGVTAEERRLVDAILDAVRQQHDLTEEAVLTADEAARFADIMRMADMGHLVDQSASLANNMALAAENAAAALAARALDVQNAPNIAYAGRGTTSSRPAFQMGENGQVTTVRSILQEQENARRAAARGSRGGSGGGGAAAAQDDYLKNLLQEAEQKRRLVGLGEEETRRQEILFELKKRELPLNDDRIEQIIQTEAETRKLIEAEQQREQLMQTIEGNIKSAFMSMVDGSQSVEDAFRNMLRNILLAVYEQQVAQPAATAIGSLISGLFNANGNVFSGGSRVTAYANGGVVNSPTYFPMSSGVGLMGEAGPEAIMPLKRGANGKLGVQVDGNAGNVTVVQNFNIAANGDESVRRIVRQEAPRIAEQAKAAVVDAKRRGGSYGRSF